jgi:transcriptional regulator with XRE-family HTH domain
VRAARERLGWGREELAFHSALSWSAIAQIESGRRRNLRPGTLSALAGALGVTIDYLVHGGPASAAMLEHQALLYDTEDRFLDTAGPFLAAGIERSEAVLAVTTGANISLLRERLGPDAKRVEFVDEATWYQSPTAALEAYQAFFSAKLETGSTWIRIVGQPTWAASSDSESRLWTRYESLVNLILAAWPVSFLCAYDERTVAPEIVRHACLTHPHTITPDGPASSPDYADPGGFVLKPDL